MRKNILAAVSIAFMAAVTISRAQTVTTRQPELPLDIGPADPAFDLRSDLETLSQYCSLIVRLNVRFRITGTIQGRRVDASVRLSAIPTLAMRLEPVVASGSSPFVLQANRRPVVDGEEDGTLYIREGNRVVRHRMSALMSAVLGLPFGTRELFQILTCPHDPFPFPFAQFGPEWFSVNTNYGHDEILDAYVHRDASHPWAYAAAIHTSATAPTKTWRIDFLERRHDVFRRLRIRSLDWVGEPDRRDDVTLLREFAWVGNVGEPVSVAIPESATEGSVDELGSAIPLITARSIQRSPSAAIRKPATR